MVRVVMDALQCTIIANYLARQADEESCAVSSTRGAALDIIRQINLAFALLR